MNKQIFRKVSLDRLSSPEQLDLLLQVTSPKDWLALLGVVILLATAGAWAFTGTLPSKIVGQGVVLRTGGVLNVVAPAPGMIVSLNVKVGDHISMNQVIAKIAQPLEMERVRAAREQLEEAQRQRERALARRTQGAELEAQAMERQRVNVQRQIEDAESQAKLAAEQIPVAEQLLAKGLVTRQSVLDARQRLVDIEGRAAGFRAQLTQLESQRYGVQSQLEQTENEMTSHIADLGRTLSGLERQFEVASNVVSPYEGEVVELKTYVGGAIAAAQPLLSIHRPVDVLELLTYVPASQAKEARAGMPAQISPSTVRREEFGFMRGKITYVSDYPATQAALMRNFQNEGLVSSLTAKGPVTEVRVEMMRDPATPSGFAWSSSQGPPTAITSGSLCVTQIVTREQKPIELFIPYVKRKLGLS